MLKRLALGLAKGLVIGGGIGAGLQLGLGWAHVGGLLGFLIAMGAGGTTGVFAGKPPWRQGAWVEAVLKGMVGVGLGALAYWAASTWGALPIPFPGLEGATAWTGLPAVFAPAIAGVYGALVELDNTGESESAAASKVQARVASEDEEPEEEEAPSERRARDKKRA